MPRTPVDLVYRKELSDRFFWILERELGLTVAQVWKQLGYDNDSTLAKARTGKTFPDYEKLRRFAKLQREDGARPNLDWVLTQEGAPMILNGIDAESEFEERVRKIATGLTLQQIDTLTTSIEKIGVTTTSNTN